MRGSEWPEQGFRGTGRRLEPEIGAVLMGKMLNRGFRTSLVDSEEPREGRGLAVPECWL